MPRPGCPGCRSASPPASARGLEGTGGASNARFSRSPPAARISARAQPTAAGCACWVGDLCIRIGPDMPKVLFEPCHQADIDTGGKYGSGGVGPAMSRDIARLLGGEIRVQSTSQHGSVFNLDLPRTYLPQR